MTQLDEQVVDPRACPLRGRRVAVGVGGGIAAYKAAELVRLLVGTGAEVRVLMTRSAQEFVGKITFQALSGQAVHTDLFDPVQEAEIGHIRLAEDADLLVIAPTTANLIARLAAGMADDLVTAVALTTRAPVLLAPAMNVNMWEHPLVQGNLRRLVAEARVQVIGPGTGFLACRATGPGRLAEPADILEACGRALTRRDLEGASLLVTAGPTHEAIDPARYLANRSSGRMGYALARAAAARGAMVTLVTGPTALAAPLGVEVVRVRSARELAEAVRGRAGLVDAVVMAAAVADYRAAAPARTKLKKQELGETPRLELAANPDVLAELGEARRSPGSRRPVLVGFAAETEHVESNAREKLARKGCDIVVANDVSQEDAGFEVDTNRVVIVRSGEAAVSLPLSTKDEVAHAVLDRVKALLA